MVVFRSQGEKEEAERLIDGYKLELHRSEKLWHAIK
jgi:hypothetical protein